ncbi:MAG: PDZ domain-containing protein, partial [Anaerolineales bacterium]|nr:PDZ domain-containing protein [Anaerolineales bacterium]
MPFLFALVVLVFLGWSVSLALVYPYGGITDYDNTGLIIEIDSLGPNFAALQEGDLILSIDGVPMIEARPIYGNKRPGDTAHLMIQRDGNMITVPIRLVIPSFDEKVNRLGPLIVALIFWGIGVGIQAFKPASEATNLFFLFFMVTALLLVAGVGSYLGPPWISSLVNILLWIIGPLAVHFHFYFPQNTPLKGRRYLLIGLYAIAILGGLPYLIWGSQVVQSSAWFPQYQLANRIFLAINFLLAVGLLFYSYRNATTAGVRGKIRIVVLGGVLALLPLVALVVIPDALLQVPIIPYTYALLWLALLPLTYGYAIFRHRLIEVERHVNRGATFILVYSILGAFYLILYVVLSRLMPPELANTAVVNTVLVLVLASVFVPLHRRIQRVVDTVFYGGWYDYRFAVSQITQGLEQLTELPDLAEAVSQRLITTLRLDETSVFLSDLAGDFSVIAVAPHPIEGDQTSVP